MVIKVLLHKRTGDEERERDKKREVKNKNKHIYVNNINV
jgi:hypothetical protein